MMAKSSKSQPIKKAGDTVPYRDAQYRLVRAGSGEWIARAVTGDV
ncbi:hypothetical protein ABIB25_003526 [Nakamurella sp. UYEF19]